MSQASRLFGVGVSGPELTPREHAILEAAPPRAVILFTRNVGSAAQLSRLTAEIASYGAIVCLDQEGGRVDRLREVLGHSVSFRAAAAAGSARRAGELAGESCSRFGVALDLAPVVDRLLPGASEQVLLDRCAAEDPEAVASAAAAFLEGLHARGVSGCIKHFPGLGRAQLDTHLDLPRIAEDPDEEARDLAPFVMTMELAGAVMVSHAAGPEGIPASLSPAKATGLLREVLGFSGAAFSDDLEMGALSAFGDLPERSARSADAGCDLLFVCSRVEEYPDCVRRVEQSVTASRRAEAAARLDAWETRVRRLSSEVRTPERPIEQIAADIAALREEGSRIA